MIIALGADHRGLEARQHLQEWLARNEYDVVNCDTEPGRSNDYPDVVYKVATLVARREAAAGVLVGGTGIGMSIAANKVTGVRAALVHDEIGAEMSRRHNDSNVLCLAADMLGMRIIDKIVFKWLTADFEGGRHARRVAKIAAIEQGLDPTTVSDSAGVGE